MWYWRMARWRWPCAQVAAHEAPVCFLDTVVDCQHFLTQRNGGGILCLLEVIVAEPVGNVQVEGPDAFSLRPWPVVVDVFSQEVALIETLGGRHTPP